MNSIKNFIKLFCNYRELIFELSKRELRDRHADQFLGLVWAYGHPILMMGIYTVLFAYVFPARFIENGVLNDFSANVFAGLVPWLFMQDLLSRSTTILQRHKNLVKQIIFPVEVLPIKVALSCIFPYIPAILFTILYSGFNHKLSTLTFAIPFLIFFQIIAMMGIAMVLSALGVFIKDIKEIVTVFCSINLFAMPVLYNPLATTDWLKWIFEWNPFSYMIWCWQDALYWGGIAHPLAWIIFPLGSILMFWFGWVIFERVKIWFGDVL
jgi:lipopolysaccharide transport system permease protein